MFRALLLSSPVSWLLLGEAVVHSPTTSEPVFSSVIFHCSSVEDFCHDRSVQKGALESVAVIKVSSQSSTVSAAFFLIRLSYPAFVYSSNDVDLRSLYLCQGTKMGYQDPCHISWILAGNLILQAESILEIVGILPRHSGDGNFGCAETWVVLGWLFPS